MTLDALPYPPAPPQPCHGLVILLHGWGANAQDLLGLAPALDLPGLQFICPNAPMTHPYSAEGRMWYDLESADWQGLEAARSQLNTWIDDCMVQFDVPSERVLVAGFSQGGAMALEVGLGRSLAGLVVLSGYLHPHLMEQSFELASGFPLLVLHGEQDPVVPFQAALQTQAALNTWGANCQFEAFPMGHEISPQALQLTRQFIASCL